MRTTIDAAGRVVVPKSLREAMHLSPGQVIDIAYHDGRLQIEVVDTPAHLQRKGRVPVVVPDAEVTTLTSDLVRDVLEDTRR